MACILYIEPQPLLRELLGVALSAIGHEMRESPDEPEDQTLWKGVDLLIVSASMMQRIGMSAIAGWARDRSALGTTAPVIALLDNNSPEVEEALRLTGIQECISTQDFTWAALSEALTRSIPRKAVTPAPAAAPAKPAEQPITSKNPTAIQQTAITHGSSSPAPSGVPRPAVPVYVPDLDEENVLKTLSPIVDRPTIDRVSESLELLQPNDVLTERVRGLLALQAEVDPLTQAISRDPVLSLRVLAWANALPGAENSPAESLRTAVDRMGRAALSTHLANLETCKADDKGGIDWLGFTLHAKAVAHIAAEVVRLRQGHAEEVQAAFTAGLLHDIGRLLFARILPTENREVLEASIALSMPIELVEQQMLLDDHAKIMDKALRHLRMGPRVVNAVACHHLPLTVARNLSGRNLADVLQIVLADRMANAILYGEPDSAALQGAEHHLHVLRLPADQVRRMLHQVSELMQKKRDLFLKDLGLTETMKLGTSLFRSVAVSPRPLFIGSDAHADPVAVFCRSLAPVESTSPPNIAVVRMTNVREREALTGKLKALEFEKGSGKLPVMLLSPKGNLNLDESAIPGRAIQLLAEPVPYARLFAALGKLLDQNKQKAAA